MTLNTTTSPTNSRVKEPPVNKSWEEMSYEASRRWADSVAECLILKKFCREYLETMEGFFDTNPDSLSYEHKIDYINCAQLMEDRYGRINNRIKEIKATL